jgi:hypothetical protein
LEEISLALNSSIGTVVGKVSSWTPKIAGRPGNPAFLTFVAGLLRSNRGDAPRSPRSGVLTPPDPPKGLIDRPVEPVASTAPELDSPAMLFATVTTPLTRLSHRTVWKGSGGLSPKRFQNFCWDLLNAPFWSISCYASRLHDPSSEALAVRDLAWKFR